MDLHLVRPRAAIALLCIACWPLHAAAQDDAAESAPPEDAVAQDAPAPAAPADTIPVPEVRAAEKPNLDVPEQPAKLDTIEVTGSRIRRADYETAQPVLVVGRDDIDRSGLISIGDLLQELPTAGAALNTSYNNGGTGTVEVDLRHLGSNRVLVLVNGRRWVSGLRSFATSSVDLTTIPISVIERIEVLKDGASAIYGSDAIAGVVNIVTRKDFDGVELRAQAGAIDADPGVDGETQAYSLSWGRVFDGGSWFLDGSYSRQDDVIAGQRKEFEHLVPGTGLTRGSGFIPQGRFLLVPQPQNELLLRLADPQACPGLVPVSDTGTAVGAVPLCDIKVRDGVRGDAFGDFERYFAAEHAYETAGQTYLITPAKHGALFGQLNYALGDSVSLDLELLYNRRESAQQLAAQPLALGDLIPFPFFNPIYIDETNPYNPFGQDIGRGVNGQPLTPGSGVVARRPLEAGPRLFTQTVDTQRAGLALGGPLDLWSGRMLTWELAYSYGQSKQKEVTTGLFDVDHLARALGPIADCDADPACVPLDLFGGQLGGGTITRQMLDYVTYTGIGSTRQQMHDAQLTLGSELFEAPWAGAPVGVAVGFEYRKEDYRNDPDPLVATGRSSTNRASPTQGGYATREAFVELSVPLARDLPLAQELDLSLAGRHSDYARFGKANTGKLGLRYRPLESVLLRGTASTAFRAPNLGELFLGNSDSFTGLADPCDSSARPTPTTPDAPDPTASEPQLPDVPGDPTSDPAVTANANATQNCASDGVNPTLVQLVPQLIEVLRGNPDLKPEKAKTLTAGIVLSPSWLPDFNLYVDWYKISIRDFITVPGAQTILNYCYLADPGERMFCEKVNRDASTGAITFIDDPFLNYARLETEGVDVGFDYGLPWFEGWGKLKLVTDATYLSKYELFAPGPGGSEVKDENAQPGRHFFSGVQALPRVKANASLSYKLGGFAASYSLRYVHKLRESCYDGIPPSLSDLGLCSAPDPQNDPESEDQRDARGENELPAVIYHNAQIGYTIEAIQTQLLLGVNNLLDKDPPKSYFASPLYGFDPSLYEVPGRQGYARLVVHF
ncbi:MAG TPA: TonB-dependent receptor [Solimonas sp.]|nr:TonB-dependent receptor [Solimonas sp.]